MAPISNPPANRDVKEMAMLSSPSFHALLTVRRAFRSASLPLAAVLVLCPGGTPLKAELLLVEDGQPRSTIVMGARASAKERLAAEELRAYLHKISGAYVSITTDADDISGTRILVGRNRFSTALDLQTADLERDDYLIDVRGSDLVLLGETDQGSMNAVYGFLEDHLGVRWFMPGEAGEDVLPRQTIRIPALQERRKPDFFAVSGLIWSGHTRGAPDWQRRNRASIGPPNFFFGHSFHNILLETPQLRARHPDWFARNYKGENKKSGQLCTSHPDVIDIAVRKAALFFDRMPEAATFGLAPEDGRSGGFCNDWRCRALDEKIGVKNGFLTDRLMYFCNQVAEGLRQLDPVKYGDKRLGFLAYQNYINPPEKVIPDEMVTVVITHMHWTFCDVHAMDDPDCSKNEWFSRMLRGWLDVTDRVGVYDYFGHNEFYVPWPLWNTTIPQHLGYYKDIGVESFIAESQQNWGTQGMNFYAAAKLAWDAQRDMEGLWDDFYTRFYGPATGPMRRYWQGWEKSMRNSGRHAWDWILDGQKSALIEASRTHLDAAWEAVETAEGKGADLGKVRSRLQLAEEGFKHTDLWYQMRRLNRAGQTGEAVSLARRIIDHIIATRGTEPQVFIEELALQHIREQLRAMGGKPRETPIGPTFPAAPNWDGRFTLPVLSGSFHPLRLQTTDVNWDGGNVEIPFSLNQRARVWLAVYEVGSSETGERGPNGAWRRFEPQDKFVYVSPGGIYAAGAHAIAWKGEDWEGRNLPAGEYEFDLIAVNNLDRPVLAGPSARTGWGSNLIDTRREPPEIWVQEYEREYAANRHRAGDVIRGTMGTDYLSDPTAWDRWSYNEVLNFDGARTHSGLRVDDRNPNVFWTTHYEGEDGGLYKMLIKRADRTWGRDLTFGNNGFAPNNEDRLMAIEPWGEVVYGAHWSLGNPPLSTIQSWDKTSGEIVREFDVSEIYSNRGPGQLGVNARGIWMTSHSSPDIAFVNHEGRLLWVNGNGDVIGDRISDQEASRLRIEPASGNNIKIQADASGSTSFVTTSGNNRGTHFSALGRDGAGLFEVVLPGRLGPFRPDVTWHLRVVDQDGGPYDGIYYGCRLGLTSHSWNYPKGQKFGPGMLMYIPFDLASGRLGPRVTAALDRNASPIDYSLGPAYPNPFNSVTVIRFQVAATTTVRMAVYNVTGQKVRTLVDGEFTPGTYRTTWDGLDRKGRSLASGVYFYRMISGDFAETRSVSMLK